MSSCLDLRWSSCWASPWSRAAPSRPPHPFAHPTPPVLVGVLIGFAPHLRQAQLPPEVVLLVFLPALLYWESLTTSLREIRNNLRVVVLTSTVLVAATAAAVAAAAHGLGLACGPAWAL